MISCGNFAILPADTLLAEGRALPIGVSTQNKYGETVMDVLRRWVFAPESAEAGRSMRRLYNVNNTEVSSLFASGIGSANYPVEVLAFYDDTGKTNLS